MNKNYNYRSWNSRELGFQPSLFPHVAIEKRGKEWIVYNKGRRIPLCTPKESCAKKQHIYVYVDMVVDGKRMTGRRMALAAIIWLRYLGREIAPGCVIDHIDENPFNNDPSNLQMLTIGDNTRKTYGHKIKKFL